MTYLTYNPNVTFKLLKAIAKIPRVKVYCAKSFLVFAAKHHNVLFKELLILRKDYVNAKNASIFYKKFVGDKSCYEVTLNEPDGAKQTVMDIIFKNADVYKLKCVLEYVENEKCLFYENSLGKAFKEGKYNLLEELVVANNHGFEKCLSFIETLKKHNNFNVFKGHIKLNDCIYDFCHEVIVNNKFDDYFEKMIKELECFESKGSKCFKRLSGFIKDAKGKRNLLMSGSCPLQTIDGEVESKGLSSITFK